MDTNSTNIQKQNAENYHSNHQVQNSEDKSKNEDQHQEENDFEPAQQRRMHGKAVVDNSSLKSLEHCIGFRRSRERVLDYQQYEALDVNSKRTRGDKGSCTPHLFGNKYRHCKVSTPKGLRDRRVRLSARTAINFYDVQDRLGFNRPSNAIDWLMKEAKAAISHLHKDSHKAQLATFVEKKSEDVIPNQTDRHMQLQSKFLDPRYSIYQATQQLYNSNPHDNFDFTSLLCGTTSSTSLDFPISQHGFEPMISQNQHLCLSPQSHQEEPTFLHQSLSPYSLTERDNGVLLGSNSINCNMLPNSYWFQNIISKNSNSKLSALHSLEGHLEPCCKQNQSYPHRETLQPSFLPSTYTSSTETDYDQMLVFNRLSGTSIAVYNELQDSEVRGLEREANPILISSSAASTFLNYR